MSSPNVLTANRITVQRGSNTVLQDVSVALTPGTLTCVVGPNGSGKSSLVGALAGDLPVTAGDVSLAGELLANVAIADRARRRAVMTQDHSVAFGFTVYDVVRMGRYATRSHTTDTDDHEIVLAALDEADIREFASRPVQQLSGGERARVAFARLLAQQTPVMLLDEPTAALDIRHAIELMGSVRSRVDGGAAALVVMHDLTLTRQWADEVLVLNQGTVAATGRPDTALTAETLSGVYGVAFSEFTEQTTGQTTLVAQPTFVAS